MMLPDFFLYVYKFCREDIKDSVSPVFLSCQSFIDVEYNKGTVNDNSKRKHLK